MSLPRYEQYKDSGVPWLGEVPAHWRVTRIKHVIRSITQGWSPQCEGFPVESADEIGVLKVGCVNGGTFNPRENKTLPAHLETRPDLSLVARDVLISRANTRELVGSTAIVDRDFPNLLLCDKLYRIRVNEEVFHAKLLGRLFAASSVRGQIELAATGASSSMLNIGQSTILELAIGVPSFEEQTAIAAFLDRETAKIDDLVAEQRNLIGLLKEKRQALISHAVTKGLDPAVPMKDSGVEWLGKVPKHWLVMPIKLAARLESGHTPSRSHPEYWENCTVPWFTLADVWQIREEKSDRVSETKEQVSELGLANSSARLLPRNTVMLSRTASVGFSAIMDIDMATTQDFANWVCGPTLIPEFLLFVLRSMQSEFRRIMMGSTHNTIYMPDIQALRFALPPLSDQQEIIEYVTTWAARCDALVTEAEASSILLQERRTALISAAVTGKIDVREKTTVQPVPELEVA